MGKATRSSTNRKNHSMNGISQIDQKSFHKMRSKNIMYRKMDDSDHNMQADDEVYSSLLESPTVARTSKSSLLGQSNVLIWLQNDAPHDIIPKVLSFLGPQKHQVLSRVNKSWRKICLSDGVFRTLCEDYGKWKTGEHVESCSHDNDMDIDGENSKPSSSSALFWREVYCRNPIVPLDYPTIQKALDATGKYTELTHVHEFKKNIRLLLEPGVHLIENSVRVHNYGNAEVRVETLQKDQKKTIFHRDVYSSSNYLPFTSFPRTDSEDSTSPNNSPSRRGNVRNVFTCWSGSVENSAHSNLDESLSPLSLSSCSDSPSLTKKAMVIIKPRKHNTPIFHVTQGTLKITNLAMVHNCGGIDIWNGNTAVQVQPLIVDHRPVIPQQDNKIPHAIVEDCNITSISGRGIVAIDGGLATIKKCCIFGCAATGIYVGGPGSSASVQESDIVRNGEGNKRNRRGIARGHSGVYLEQGIANLVNCNISNNSLTGISAISQTNATLIVKDSDLVGNGSVQLELPPEGSLSRQRSSSENNNISVRGEGRSRVGEDLEDDDEDGSDSDV